LTRAQRPHFGDDAAGGNDGGGSLFFEQTQSGFLHQSLGVGGNLCEPRLLLGRKVDLHVDKGIPKRALGQRP
jgi:hypothetical protein